MTISPFWKVRWNLRRRILSTTCCGPVWPSAEFSAEANGLRSRVLGFVVVEHLAGLLAGDHFFRFGGALAAKFIFIPVGGGFMIDHDLGLDGDGPFVGFGIHHGQGDLGHAQSLAVTGAGKDDVLHVGAAQGFGALFAEYPTYPIEDVRLAAPIGSHHHGDARARHRELGAVTEAFEAEDMDFFQFQHVDSRDGPGVFRRKNEETGAGRNCAL